MVREVPTGHRLCANPVPRQTQNPLGRVWEWRSKRPRPYPSDGLHAPLAPAPLCGYPYSGYPLLTFPQISIELLMFTVIFGAKSGLEAPVGEREWLTLSEASELLGVHPATLRVWADEGYIKTFRTPGGHRRFLASELEAMVAPAGAWGRLPGLPDSDPQEARGPGGLPQMRSLVAQARQEISSLGERENAWLVAFPPERRGPWRDSGRRLIGLAIQYVSRQEGRQAVLDEGRAIGALYGRQCASIGVSLADTVRAFLFFRESLLRSTRPGLVAAGRYDAEDARIHREMREFLDEALYAMLNAFDATPRTITAGAQ